MDLDYILPFAKSMIKPQPFSDGHRAPLQKAVPSSRGATSVLREKTKSETFSLGLVWVLMTLIQFIRNTFG
jgi:hypothetical protein